MGPITSNLRASNDHKAALEWISSGSYYMKSDGFDRLYIILHNAICRQSLLDNNSQVCTIGLLASDRLMDTAYAIMSLFEYFLCLLVDRQQKSTPLYER